MILISAGRVLGRVENSPKELPDCPLCLSNINAGHQNQICSAHSLPLHTVDIGRCHSFLSDEVIVARQGVGRMENKQGRRGIPLTVCSFPEDWVYGKLWVVWWWVAVW